MSFVPQYQGGWVATPGTGVSFKYDPNAQLVQPAQFIVHLESTPTSGGTAVKAKSLPGGARNRFQLWPTAMNVSGLVTMVGGFFSGHPAYGWLGGLCYGGGVVMQLLTAKKDY